jgi:hypothetical protein
MSVGHRHGQGLHDAMNRHSSARSDVRTQGLFPCEAEVARRLSQELSDWQAKAPALERHGLPRIDPLMGGRYWPAVQAWWNRRYGLSNIEASQPDGEEDLNALR